MAQQTTGTLTELLGQAVEAALLELRTVTVGRVESYSATDQRATVTPLLKRMSAAGELIQPRPIPNIPVLQLRAGGFFIGLPVAVGDTGLLLCSDRSLDLWLAGDGGPTDPQSGRHHQLTDAVFLPGVCSWSQVPAAPSGADVAGSIVLGAEDGSAWLSLSPDGNVRVKAMAVRLADPAATKALALAESVDARLAALVTALNTHVHTGVTTGVGLSGIAATPTGTQATVAASSVYGR